MNEKSTYVSIASPALHPCHDPTLLPHLLVVLVIILYTVADCGPHYSIYGIIRSETNKNTTLFDCE